MCLHLYGEDNQQLRIQKLSSPDGYVTVYKVLERDSLGILRSPYNGFPWLETDETVDNEREQKLTEVELDTKQVDKGLHFYTTVLGAYHYSGSICAYSQFEAVELWEALVKPCDVVAVGHSYTGYACLVATRAKLVRPLKIMSGNVAVSA